jgi:alcohol dehydrogenase, propanol-preferring
MRAWVVGQPGPIESGPLRLTERDVPVARPGELLVRVRACGVCRTDLHLAEGDLAPKAPGITPGHQVVGDVVQAGPGGTRFRAGDRVGVAWLAWTCGVCRFCVSGRENLCIRSVCTGWDIHGGYAEYVLAAEAYVHPLPPGWPDADLAPLLCAGIIGYRALRHAELPPGGRLGIYGFGGSAHLAAQIAVAQGAAVHVFTRSERARLLAMELGAESAQEPGQQPARPLDSAIIFAPAGELVPVALAALDRGGTLAIAGIHVSTVPALDYDTLLFQERQVRSVTSNTRVDAAEFLTLAARLKLQVVTTQYGLGEADRALHDLAGGRVNGAGVLMA